MANTLLGLVVHLEAPYFACFRRPASTSIILTYPVPPFTTILGLVANALGVPRAAYAEALEELQQRLYLNLRPLIPPERPSRELAKILKLVGEEREQRRPSSFPSSPMHRYFLVRPSFRLFLAGERETIFQVAQALRTPKRPLYLGQSDDMVLTDIIWQGEAAECQSSHAWALVPGVWEEGSRRVEILRLPLAFKGERTLLYSEPLTLPSHFPFPLPQPQTLWRFGEETVHLFLPAGLKE